MRGIVGSGITLQVQHPLFDPDLTVGYRLSLLTKHVKLSSVLIINKTFLFVFERKKNLIFGRRWSVDKSSTPMGYMP